MTKTNKTPGRARRRQTKWTKFREARDRIAEARERARDAREVEPHGED